MNEDVQGPSWRMKKSLLLRLGIAMGAIIILAMIGMFSSIFVAENSEGFAAAINHAGTLRMQSYRVASSLVHGTGVDADGAGEQTRRLVEEFEERLHSPRIHKVLGEGAAWEVVDAYQTVEQEWVEAIRPHLERYLDLISSPQIASKRAEIASEQIYYLSGVDNFVQKIHALVKALELDENKRNEQLRLIQIISIIITLLVAAFTLYLTQRSILTPLKDLLLCAGAARHGDLSVRSRYVGEDELGQLGYAFNLMAEDLSKHYADFAELVHEKTADLERSNHSLELLYSTTKRLSESSLDEDVLEGLIHDIEQLTGVSGGTICLGGPGDQRAFRLASTINLNPDGLGGDCSRCFGDGTSHQIEISNIGGKGCRTLYSVPIRDQENHFGVLLVELSTDDAAELEDWQKPLLETVVSHIALAINTAQKASQNRLLSLLEERSVIARELHDSIAQSLSYLKIQVSRLEKSITDECGRDDNLVITARLRSALNGAYRQLRELLATFRLRISEAGLGAALEATVMEFRERSEIEIVLVDRIANCKFDPNSEIHLIQIIREALSNVIRHANATHAHVSVECDQKGEVTLLVEDDGVGIDEESDVMLHYGMPIMKERAERLGGSLTVSESPSGGTSVKLAFSVSDPLFQDQDGEAQTGL
ncbi:MAG: type IV pili methyl-accepting chemotaxis transducer N-terminal domain-containing protein [Candidatus Sedimenticola sp. (ex Thyasira tokunagai)]